MDLSKWRKKIDGVKKNIREKYPNYCIKLISRVLQMAS